MDSIVNLDVPGNLFHDGNSPSSPLIKEYERQYASCHDQPNQGGDRIGHEVDVDQHHIL